MSRVDIKELEKAVKYLKEKLYATHVDISFDVNDRTLLKTTSGDGEVVVTLYRSDTNRFAEITETRRL